MVLVMDSYPTGAFKKNHLGSHAVRGRSSSTHLTEHFLAVSEMQATNDSRLQALTKPQDKPVQLQINKTT